MPEKTLAELLNGSPTVLEMLGRIPDMAEEALKTHNHPNPSPRTHGGSNSSMNCSKPPTDLAALDAIGYHRGSNLFNLVSDCELIWNAMPDAQRTTPANPSVSYFGVCAWLAEHFTWWTTVLLETDARRTAKDIRRAYHDLAQAIRQERPVVLACLVTGCNGDVLLSPDEEGTGRHLPDACTNGHDIHVGELLHHALELQEVTMDVLSQRTGIPSKTLYRWVAAGLLTPVRKRGRNQLFRVSDARSVAKFMGRA